MKSPIYWHPNIYRLVMKLLYGKYFEARYKCLSELIPPMTSVVEPCAGDAYLYRNYLKAKGTKYVGLDINPVFVQAAKKKNISFFINDLLKDNVPVADYIVLQASLYQFMPHELKIIRKLLDSAKSTLIIAEPIRNLADSHNPIIRLLAKYSANPGGSNHPVKRFNKDTFHACLKQFDEFKELKIIDGGREMIGVLRK